MLDVDDIRLEAAKLQAFADTENTLTYLARDAGVRTLCWTYRRRFCENVRPDYANTAYADFDAGALVTAEVTQDLQVLMTRALLVDAHAVADHVFRGSDLSALMTQSIYTIGASPAPLGRLTVYEATLHQTQDTGADVTIGGQTFRYQTRTVTLAIPANDTEHSFPGPDGGKLRAIDVDQVLIPALSPGVFSTDDLAEIRAGRLTVAKINGFDALLVLGALGSASPDTRDANVLCTIERLAALPPLTLDIRPTVLNVVTARDPLAAIRTLLVDGDGAKLFAYSKERWRPVKEACHLPIN